MDFGTRKMTSVVMQPATHLAEFDKFLMYNGLLQPRIEIVSCHVCILHNYITENKNKKM